MTAVKEHRQLVFSDHFVEFVGHAVVGHKALHRWVEFEAFDFVFFDQFAGLACTHFALVWVNTTKSDHRIGVFQRGFCHLFAGNAMASHLVFGVNGKHDQADLAFAVIGNRLINRRTLIKLKILRGCFVVLFAILIIRLATGDFGVRVNVDGDQIGYIQDLSS